MSGASERANGRASGPVLQTVFLAVLDHSVKGKSVSERRCFFGLGNTSRGCYLQNGVLGIVIYSVYR